MDPKKIAEEIIQNMFASSNNPEEIHEEEEEETEQDEEEESEEEQEEEEETGEEAHGQQNTSPVARSVQMKPTGTAGASPMSQSPTSDAHGGTTRDVFGRGSQFAPTVSNGDQGRASLQMKPSFASAGQMPMMNSDQMREDVKAMFGGSEDLSEEFINRASNLYEAAIISNVQAITEELSNQFSNKLVEAVTEVANTLEEQVDDYLNYVVEEWVEENKLVITQGLRTEIAENFISNLKDLFSSSYIDVPEDKVNAFDEMAIAVETLESRVNEEMQNNVALSSEIQDLKASMIFTEETETLSDLDAENVKKLVENLRFENDDSFRSNVQTLVEGYIRGKVSNKLKNNISADSTVYEEESSQQEPSFISESMQKYVNVLGRTFNS